MSRLALAIFAAGIATGPLHAAGSDDDEPPTPTQTTTECEEGTVWDETSKECVAPKESSLDDDVLYNAARELAWAGRYDDAIAAIAAMADAESDRALTYLGFAHRKSGRIDVAMIYYRSALSKNPDNLLAKSYMGQAFAESGNKAAALGQLVEIRARGGRESWAYVSLKSAIREGRGYSY